jgi:hypothetical protein
VGGIRVTGKCNLRTNEFRSAGPAADGTDVLDGVLRACDDCEYVVRACPRDQSRFGL